MSELGSTSLPYRDAGRPVAERVADLIARMTLDEKIGQMIQVQRAAPPEIAGFSPEEAISAYGAGSVLSAGGSAPTPNTAEAWADMYDAFQRLALATRLGIPIIYGTDSVHGHSTLHGATVFPHNIGLGATRDPELARRVGEATARELRATGPNWAFSPCVAVVQDARWGRTYESFGEREELVTAMAGAVVTGLQSGDPGAPHAALACAKHFVGDGGTDEGVDTGDNTLDEAELRRLHLPPYQAAIRAGVATVMASYSSWHGTPLHVHRYLLTDVLKGDLGFTGFVVSDWCAIGRLDETGFENDAGNLSPEKVRDAVNAGVDMAMLPYDYHDFREMLAAEVTAGRVTVARIDDAVTRILTQKVRLGLFEEPFADRSRLAVVGSAGHRALGREAVARSVVLLKNEGDLLPLPGSGARVLVTGKNAHDIGNQCGGWTLSWEGASGPTVPGTTILEGIREFAPDAAFDRTAESAGAGFDVAVVVVGETPYVETEGDRPDGLFLDDDDRAVLERVRAAGVPAVVVLVSGRPLDVSAHIDGWSAVLAAWLPGTEGGGVADVLFGAVPPAGKLPVTWFAGVGEGGRLAGELFAYGAGLTYDVVPLGGVV